MGGCASKDKNDKVVVSADGEASAGVTGEGDAAGGDVNDTKASGALPNSGGEANGEATKLNAEEGCVFVKISVARRQQEKVLVTLYKSPTYLEKIFKTVQRKCFHNKE